MRCFFCSNTSSLNAFYSRRVGRPPQLAGFVDGVADASDTPENTSIIAAAKITGRTSGGYTIGVLDAVTGEETARYRPAGGGAEAKQVVEPLTNYFVGRVKKEFRNGATTVGGILTSVARPTDDPVADARLHSHAESAGVDWYHTWHGRNYSWMGTTLFTNVAGSPDAIARTQRSSARYFQRPDREGGGYDPSATSLQGFGLFTRVGKDNGGALRWEAMANTRTPGFENNDSAYVSKVDYLWLNGNIGGSFSTPTKTYRSIFTSIGGATERNFDGDRTRAALQAYFGMEFLNYWNLRTFWIHEEPSLDDRLTRGGPVVKRTGYDFGHFQVSTDARKAVVFDVAIEGSKGIGADTRTFDFSPGVALKPTSNIFIELSPTFSYNEGEAQYVTSVADPTATAFFGNRYVFGAIRTRTVSINTRLNWTFTPTLTLQLFAQPFVASGDYSSFREFAAPRTLAKRIYGVDMGTIERRAGDGSYVVDPDGSGPARAFSFGDPNFTTGALRGTAVLRWEYRPGSTLYFVWTQQRSSYDPASDFGYDRARTAIFDQRPMNVVQVKLTYWIGR
jgi:hypothetical protein